MKEKLSDFCRSSWCPFSGTIPLPELFAPYSDLRECLEIIRDSRKIAWTGWPIEFEYLQELAKRCEEDLLMIGIDSEKSGYCFESIPAAAYHCNSTSGSIIAPDKAMAVFAIIVAKQAVISFANSTDDKFAVMMLKCARKYLQAALIEKQQKSKAGYEAAAYIAEVESKNEVRSLKPSADKYNNWNQALNSSKEDRAKKLKLRDEEILSIHRQNGHGNKSKTAQNLRRYNGKKWKENGILVDFTIPSEKQICKIIRERQKEFLFCPSTLEGQTP